MFVHIPTVADRLALGVAVSVAGPRGPVCSVWGGEFEHLDLPAAAVNLD
jgi:hypothetical protein